jgi:hypothetical protein
MASKREILDSELVREIIAIRIDTVWSMLALRRSGRLPAIDAEKSTGDLDDKGGLFLPGGIVLQDWEGRPIVPEPFRHRDGKHFRRALREAMHHDGAHLIFADGMATCVKLGNTAFAKVATGIVENRREALRRRRRIGEKRPEKIGSSEICKSYCPTYIPPPYGLRTSLSSVISACLTEPRMYFRQCQDYFHLRGRENDQLWDGIRSALQPVIGEGNTVLSPPFVVTCHNTRYREASLTGLTRLSGFGRFGEFATLTLEVVSAELLHEVEGGRVQLSDDEIVAEWDGVQVAVVLRQYPRTNPGARLLKGVTATLVSPARDLGLDLEQITAEAKARYA